MIETNPYQGIAKHPEGSFGQHEFDISRAIFFRLGSEFATKRPTMPEERKQLHPLYLDHAHLLSESIPYQASREAHGLDKQKDLYRPSGRSPLELLTGDYTSSGRRNNVSYFVATDALSLYSRANGGNYVSPDISGGYHPGSPQHQKYSPDQGPLY